MTQKYSFLIPIKNFVASQAKSDFIEVLGHKMFLDPTDSLGLSIYGTHEKLETELVTNEIKKNDVVLDIGANIGYFTLIFARLVGKDGKVFAFEPEPNNFSLLKKNVSINNYNNVICENVALANKKGKTNLYLSEVQSGGHRIYSSSLKHSQVVEVDMITLDDYFKTNSDEKISFIKIDVEGAEFGVLKGMTNLLQKNKQLKILLEFAPSYIKEFGYKPKDILDFLQSQNFEFYYTNDETQKIEKIDDVMFLLKKFDDSNLKGEHKGTNILCKRI